MKDLKKLFMAALAAVFAVSATAQETATAGYHKYPYAFVGVQGGVQGLLSSDCKLGKTITPIVALSVGGQFNNVVGARLHVAGLKGKNGLLSTGDTYKFNSLNANLDLMLNMSNLLTGRKYSVFNAYLLGGVGVNCEWDNGAEALTGFTEDMTNIWHRHQINHNFRMGVQLAFAVCKQLDVNIEAGTYAIGDRYESVYNGRYDWQGYLMAGLTFNFGHKKKAKIEETPIIAPRGDYQETVVTEQATTNTNTVVEQTVVEPASIERSIFFVINKSEVRECEIGKVDEIAAFMHEYPTANLVMTGYADKGTGNAKINNRLSRLRVQAVVEALTSRGVEVTRIFTNFLGDTVQPYQDNDLNRVVIGIAREQK